jgi:GNAT superfamily N-acetyltransferase
VVPARTKVAAGRSGAACSWPVNTTQVSRRHLAGDRGAADRRPADPPVQFGGHLLGEHVGQDAEVAVLAGGHARTFVWHGGDKVVVAYFSLAAHLVVRADLPPRLGRGSPDAIPAVLLARLALDRSLQGQGLGGELLVDALSRAVQASEVAAARLVVVDAIDEAAAAFYEHHGFVAVPGNRQRLVQKVNDIAAALGG